MLREEERVREVDVIYLGAPYSGVSFRQIGRGNGDGTKIKPTPVPLGVVRVKDRYQRATFFSTCVENRRRRLSK